ncbi:MAG: SIS domain-containing protein [Gemmatimonadetes bacterium]|nr:SIS domain-containing protein [Gemmatimonadota bacterium]
MSTDDFFDVYFRELSRRLQDAGPEDLRSLCDVLTGARGHKVIVVGNGGSSAIASHVAVDLTKAAGVRALTFNDADLITCFGNDYGYEHWVARAVDFYADAGDVGVFISSSGRSPNILNGARRAVERGLTVVTLSGFDSLNPLRTLGEINLWVNSRNYNVVETTHQSWLVSAVDRIAGVAAAS